MRLIDGDYLYNKLVANKCPYDLVLQMVKDEPTVCDIEQIRDEIDHKQYDFMSDGDYDEGIRFGLMLAYQIIDKYKGDKE